MQRTFIQGRKAVYDKMFPKALETFQRAIVRQIVICDESFPNMRFKRPWATILLPLQKL